jgi:hypothetical protein
MLFIDGSGPQRSRGQGRAFWRAASAVMILDGWESGEHYMAILRYHFR